MSLVKWIFIGLLGLPAAEIVAFILVAAMIGWLPAFVLFLATSLAGLLLLRRSGRDNLARFRDELAARGIEAVHLEAPGMAPMLGGILLLIPGFITDLIGAALFLPGVRRWAAAKLAAASRQHRRARRDDRVIDLEPGDWRQIPDRRRGRRKRKDGA